RACAARFKTDFFFFFTLVACPWAIYCSFCVLRKPLTLNEAFPFVKRPKSRFFRANRDASSRHRRFCRGETASSAPEQTRRAPPAGEFTPPHHHDRDARRGASRTGASGSRRGACRPALHLERYRGLGQGPRRAHLQHRESRAGGR